MQTGICLYREKLPYHKQSFQSCNVFLHNFLSETRCLYCTQTDQAYCHAVHSEPRQIVNLFLYLFFLLVKYVFQTKLSVGRNSKSVAVARTNSHRPNFSFYFISHFLNTSLFLDFFFLIICSVF